MFRAAVVLAAAVASACGDSTSSTPVAPPVTLTNEFTGTLTPNGAQTEPFIVQSSGAVAASILSLTPDSTSIVSFGLGVWDGASCQTAPGVWNDKATTGTTVLGQATASGALCVRIADAQGTLTQPQAFDISVTHF